MRWAGNFEGTRNTFAVKSHREGKLYRDHIRYVDGMTTRLKERVQNTFRIEVAKVGSRGKLKFSIIRIKKRHRIN